MQLCSCWCCAPCHWQLCLCLEWDKDRNCHQELQSPKSSAVEGAFYSHCVQKDFLVYKQKFIHPFTAVLGSQGAALSAGSQLCSSAAPKPGAEGQTPRCLWIPARGFSALLPCGSCPCALSLCLGWVFMCRKPQEECFCSFLIW